MICNVSSLVRIEQTIHYRAAIGLSGVETYGVLHIGSCLGDLALELSLAACRTVKPFVYLLLPGSNRPVSALLVHSPLISFIV